MKPLYISLVAAALLSACANYSTAQEPASFAGGVLVAPNGMTLYVFDRDSPGKSNCYGPCATNWPPFFAESGAQAGGDYSLITRTDGKQMWAYKGKPLYFWIKDKKPGDTTGAGVNNVWRIVTP